MTETKAAAHLVKEDPPTAGLQIVSGADRGAAATSVPRRIARARAVNLNRALRIAGGTLTAIGIVVVAFALYVVVFTNLHASRAQQRLLSHFGSASPAFRGQLPAEGGPVAVLSIPALNLQAAVVQGTSAQDLQAGPGLMPDTAFPGTGGNSVIAGRRLSFGHYFAHLDRLRTGDQLQVTDALGRFTYEVTSVGLVRPGQVDPISPSRAAQLTLITSNSSSSPWPTGRYAVEASLIGSPAAAAPVPKGEPPTSERALAGDGSALPQIVLWTVLLLLSVVLAVVAYKRWRQPVAIYLLSTPILLAVVALAFENWVRLLPATL